MNISSDFKPSQTDAGSVVDFWIKAGPAMWFAKDPAFDRQFHDRFLTLHAIAARGGLDDWAPNSEGALALLILLDQFPRNAFRGTPRMYATDEKARQIAGPALEAGLHKEVPLALRKFFVLPFAHSEDIIDQKLSLAFAPDMGEPDASHAVGHHDIVARFGRFPHRNPILGRRMTEKEQAYLDQGGYKG